MSGEVTVLLNTFTPDFYLQYFRDLGALAGAGQGGQGPVVSGATGSRPGRG